MASFVGRREFLDSYDSSDTNQAPFASACPPAKLPSFLPVDANQCTMRNRYIKGLKTSERGAIIHISQLRERISVWIDDFVCGNRGSIRKAANLPKISLDDVLFIILECHGDNIKAVRAGPTS